MILVCGGLADRVTELVCARLQACDYPYRLLDLGRYPSEYAVAWRWWGGAVTGYIEGPGWKLDLEEVTSVFVRFVGPEARRGTDDVTLEQMQALYLECDAGLLALIESLSCLVINRVGGGLSNSSKVYQSMLIRGCGLKTPGTLVTTDPLAARAFFDAYDGQVIYKSLSGVRSIIRRLDDESLARLPLLKNGPTQFQEYVPGDDLRVHTVGDRLFTTRVRSRSVDYRYASDDGEEVEMDAADLPGHIADACRRLARQLDLTLSGIDLRKTPSGEYYCFEVNPCPGFLYYEKHSRLPISLALADLLHRGPSGMEEVGIDEAIKNYG